MHIVQMKYELYSNYGYMSTIKEPLCPLLATQLPSFYIIFEILHIKCFYFCSFVNMLFNIPPYLLSKVVMISFIKVRST